MGSIGHVMPSMTDVLVIGGGPAGSYAATLLARDGFNVTLAERDVFPRYHIGESLLPSARQYLSLIDAERLIDSQGFTVKPGAAFKLNHTSPESYTSFIEVDPSSGTWNVVRSEFDEHLLKHAAHCGADVFDGVQVSSIEFDAQNTSRPVAAQWISKTGETGTTKFNYLIDASGRAGIMSSKYLKNRKFNTSLKKVAFWGYWEGAGTYAPGTVKENSPLFEALTDQSGWAWFIPLHNGTVSVGFVLAEPSYTTKRKAMNEEVGNADMHELYLDQLKLTPNVRELLGDAELRSGIKTERDYSYSAPTYSGDHFRIIGDAGAFVDPYFSSGVHLAFTSGLSAACTIAASSRGMCSEQDAQIFHDLKFGTAYTRFLILVLGVYKQIKAQDEPVLHDVDEEGFDRAFALLRPVIQGSVEFEKTLTESEVQAAIEFFTHLFPPVDFAKRHEVMKRVDPALLEEEGPPLLPEQVKNIVGEEDKEAQYILNKINVRKNLREVYDVQGQFAREVYGGYVLTCKGGKLGLVKV